MRAQHVQVVSDSPIVAICFQRDHASLSQCFVSGARVALKAHKSSNIGTGVWERVRAHDSWMLLAPSVKIGPSIQLRCQSGKHSKRIAMNNECEKREEKLSARFGGLRGKASFYTRMRLSMGRRHNSKVAARVRNSATKRTDTEGGDLRESRVRSLESNAGQKSTTLRALQSSFITSKNRRQKKRGPLSLLALGEGGGGIALSYGSCRRPSQKKNNFLRKFSLLRPTHTHVVHGSTTGNFAVR